MKKFGKASLNFDEVYLDSASAVVGPLEKAGPLEAYFDIAFTDNYCGEKTWEKAEMRLLQTSLNNNFENYQMTEIDLVLLGDLNNQLAVSNYVMRDISIPFLGVYSACATFTETIIIGANFLESNFARNIICGASSHNSTSERQFRNPTEYGGQKSCTTTFTSTGAGTCVLTKQNKQIRVTKATIGEVIDAKMTDQTNLGQAMAPAAANTLLTHLNDFNAKIADYDLILTGDLSYYGKKVFTEILLEHGVDLCDKYEDCGILLYDRESQNVYAGGSGSSCSAIVTLGYIVKKLLNKELKKVLIIATGALMNPIMIAQKDSIPCIAHAIVLERV